MTDPTSYRLNVRADLAEACGEEPSATCRLVYDLSGNEALAQVADLLFLPLRVALILLVAVFLVRLLRRFIGRVVNRIVAVQARHGLGRTEQEAAMAALRSHQRADTLGALIRNMASVFVYTVAILIALSELNIDVAPLIASAGILGIAFGFGAQSLVKDFLAGVFMVLEDQYGVGDSVDLGEASGEVEAITLRTTLVRGIDGTLWFVPNGEIRRVGNMSQQWARAVLDIEVAVDTDIEKARLVIKKIADELWQESLPDATIIEEPAVWGVESVNADAIVLRLALKTEAGEQWATARIIRQRLKEAFDREGINIPPSQSAIWQGLKHD